MDGRPSSDADPTLSCVPPLTQYSGTVKVNFRKTSKLTRTKSRRPYRPASKIGANDQKGFKGISGALGGIEGIAKGIKRRRPAT